MGEHPWPASEVHKSIPALCLFLDGGVKKAKPSLSLSQLFRKRSSWLLLNPPVSPPGRHDDAVLTLSLRADREASPQPAVMSREGWLVCGESAGRWTPAVTPGTGWEGWYLPLGRGLLTVPCILMVPPSWHEVAVFSSHFSALDILDITFTFPKLLFFFLVDISAVCYEWFILRTVDVALITWTLVCLTCGSTSK